MTRLLVVAAAAGVALAVVFPCPTVAASSIAGELAVLGVGGW